MLADAAAPIAMEPGSAAAALAKPRALSLEAVGMTKIFGPLVALGDVSIKVPAGSFHALLGENGAGKSTLVKCIMGFYQADQGQVLLDGHEVAIRNPRDARANGVGMVYQHFTLVPSLTVAENLLIARADAPGLIDWRKEMAGLEAFLARMPFQVPLTKQVHDLAAGEKQKLEILKQLYLDQRFLILDEPTSVLTPGEADEILGLVRAMTQRGDITVLMITHKFREVTAFADDVTVLRRGRLAGSGHVGTLSTDEMARMMIGDTPIRPRASRSQHTEGQIFLEFAGVFADGDDGRSAVASFDLKVRAGEIVGIAGVSGNGQRELVEALSGQRPIQDGRILVKGEPYEPTRNNMDRFKVFGLPEEPLKNATVRKMSVAENMAFRVFDKPPITSLKWWLSPAPIRARARTLIQAYRVKTASPDSAIETLSGGNVQRAVLARELSGDVDVLIVANPCFGLDFASVAEIRAQIVEARNRGAAVLLVSEDLDEILDLADRVAVMSEGRISYVAAIEDTDRTTIGRYMAGHGH
jgi:simple sugar transport system ATP-binding protein